MRNCNWRDIPANSIAWRDKTLGEIADMGPRHWRRCTDIGDMAVEVIKWMIDEAAEGRPRMLSMHGQPASDAYVPKCERDQQ